MTKLEKKRRSRYFQQIIAKAMQLKSNMNVKGDLSFAEMQAKRDETLNHLYDTIIKVSDHEQSQRIVNIVKTGIRGNEFVDAMPIMAIGDVMAYMRDQVRKSIKEVRSYDSIESVVDLDRARACQHCNNMIAVYWMVQKAYYTLYKRFMAECNRPAFSKTVY